MKTTINGNEITAESTWNMDDVRRACIRNNLYTCGTVEEYDAMLDLVYRTEPTLENLYAVAQDINEHSEEQTVTNIMFILNREAVWTTYEINGRA